MIEMRKTWKAMSFIAINTSYRSSIMRATITIDDQLLDKARALTGLVETSALVREGLKAIIERESARRLARLGGSEADAATASRRRFTSQST
jgi:Arc/MetJ family transcription regulator